MRMYETFNLDLYSENAQRYKDALSNDNYNAAVVDLDGVFLNRNRVEKDPFDMLMDKTILNPEGRVPLSIASGRTVEEIEKILLPEIQRAMLENDADELKEGDLIIFASNGAICIDIAVSGILYASPIDLVELGRAQMLKEVQAIVAIAKYQSTLIDGVGQRCVDRAKIIHDTYTYSLGFNPKKLDLVSQINEKGMAAVEEFLELYDEPTDLHSVVEQLNLTFEERGIALIATTSGTLIDINARGVSKDSAIQVTRQLLAQRTGLSLGEVRPETILSLGDSPLGNDRPITRRRGGYTNVGQPLEESIYPIVINEDGDQYERVAHFLNKVRLSPIGLAVTSRRALDSDYLIPFHELQIGMPNGEITDKFDVTGAQKITMQEAQSIITDPTLPSEVRRFFMLHSSIELENGESTVFFRGKPYYQNLAPSANNQHLYNEMLKVSCLVRSLDHLGDRLQSNNHRNALLSLLDHGKAYVLKLLNDEVEQGMTQDNSANIAAYSAWAESYVDDYYRTLLYEQRKGNNTYLPTLPLPKFSLQKQIDFNNRIREMDQPLSIAMQVNYIAEEMRDNGLRYDTIVTPLFGAVELGFALRSMLSMKGFDHLPDTLPVCFSGKRAREGESQHDIFPQYTKLNITGRNVLILDDNSGTGITIRRLKDELAWYCPAIIHAAVVQVGTTTRIERVLKKEKSNYNRAILMPEDIAFKSVQVYNLKESIKKARQLQDYISLEELLNREIMRDAK